jgi:Fur family transcriptional regulator, zinc uptake regulator
VPKTAHTERSHDHARCISKALETAERVCAARLARLTPVRRRVLEIVWRSHDPIGAYDIVARLPRSSDRPAAPMTVYRALDFLVQQGLVHRVESLNAYVGCDRADDRHGGQLLVCKGCGAVAEILDQRTTRALAATAEQNGFQWNGSIEIPGTCRKCRGEGHAH